MSILVCGGAGLSARYVALQIGARIAIDGLFFSNGPGSRTPWFTPLDVATDTTPVPFSNAWWGEDVTAFLRPQRVGGSVAHLAGIGGMANVLAPWTPASMNDLLLLGRRLRHPGGHPINYGGRFDRADMADFWLPDLKWIGLLLQRCGRRLADGRPGHRDLIHAGSRLH